MWIRRKAKVSIDFQLFIKPNPHDYTFEIATKLMTSVMH